MIKRLIDRLFYLVGDIGDYVAYHDFESLFTCAVVVNIILSVVIIVLIIYK